MCILSSDNKIDYDFVEIRRSNLLISSGIFKTFFKSIKLVPITILIIYVNKLLKHEEYTNYTFIKQ